ncbi:hypothetical protein NL676_008497 [Syzygium grande]|nr:hypothetical protein NL676_008497 [Syzygium grande]
MASPPSPPPSLSLQRTHLAPPLPPLHKMRFSSIRIVLRKHLHLGRLPASPPVPSTPTTTATTTPTPTSPDSSRRSGSATVARWVLRCSVFSSGLVEAAGDSRGTGAPFSWFFFLKLWQEMRSDFLPFVVEDQIVGYVHHGFAYHLR